MLHVSGSMVYNSTSGHAILFGGRARSNEFNDTWAYRVGPWSDGLRSDRGPAPLMAAAPFADAEPRGSLGWRCWMSAGRFKSYDYAVVGLFVLVLIGVSLSWYTVSLSYQDASLEGGAGGWHYAWGILAFIAGLFALIVAGLKGLVEPGALLPGWYKEGPLLMGLGDLVALFAIIGFLDKPGGGVESIGELGFKVGYGAGIYLTLIAGLLIGVCGLVARFDQRATAGARSSAPRTSAGSAALGAGVTCGEAAPWPATAVASPARTEFKLYCPACTAELVPRSTSCDSCGMPLI